MKEKDMKRRKAEKQAELSEKKVRMPMQSKKNKIKIKWLLFFPAMLYWICRFNYLVWCLRIAPLRSSSRNSTNIRNPLIYYVNRYFLMFGGFQVQKPYHASMIRLFDLLPMASLNIVIVSQWKFCYTKNNFGLFRRKLCSCLNADEHSPASSARSIKLQMPME